MQALLADGRLTPGVRVPSERDLAAALGVGRGTVAAAYERMRASGHLVRRRGSGTWTATPTEAPPLPFTPAPSPAGTIDLAHAAPTAPAEAVTEAGHAALAALPAHLCSAGYDVVGLSALREAVADRLADEGLPTHPDEVLITSGSQHAHSLVARALVRPGDRVVLDQPTYPNAIGLVHDSSARPVPVSLERSDDGTLDWDVRALAAALRESTPATAYLVADQHNPTGAVMGAATREGVVDAFRRHGVPIVVDDSLRDTWIDAPPPPCLGSFAGPRSESTVITIGSLSKTVWAGLRIGWLRAPRALVRRIATTRASDDVAPPVLGQLMALALLERHDELAATNRARLRAGRDHLLRALPAALPDWSVRRPGGGMALWADLGAPRSSALAEAAPRHGLVLASGPRFGVGGAFESRLRVPYTLPLDVLDDAVVRLAATWDDLDRAPSVLTTVV
ncbi:uncharacterized protein LOC110428928 [Herrania umbratica]|uniref:Uncharacterized protein LOC110428928 n=1 Tax=Herrania umbratica TaxID=108875 RepID=A0A6J1BQI0_9ROSI|nr:uncharacterized protein LOC110428928 [Herrania umbratica]